MAQEWTPEQWQQLAAYASRRLQVSPEQLKAAFESGGLHAVAEQTAGKLDGGTAAQINALAQDPARLNALMNDPRIRQMMEQLLGKGK